MNRKLLHRALGASVFVVSAVQFLLTAQPSVSFWDPGELSAAAYLLQVPHPPGGPLFSLVGRLFYLLPIPGDLGFRMNMLSVLASAFSVLLLYLVAVRLMKNFKGKEPRSAHEAWGTYVSAAIGALALSFCDTFWFNAVESNYFAASTLLYASMIWLMLIWHEKADQPGSSKYLLLIAYLVGLSAGLHLMSVPAFFVVTMVVVFKRYVTDDAVCRQTASIFLGHIVLLLLVTYGMWSGLTSTQIPSPDEFHAYDLKFMTVMGIISAVVMVVFRKKIFRKDSFYVPILAAGASLGLAYPGVIKKLPAIIHTVSRNDSSLGVGLLLAVLAGLGYLAYRAGKQQKTLLHLSALAVLFVILGFSTYTMIVIRANAHTPMNENEPKNFSRLMSYLNREQYGDFPIFKRRWTPDADRQRTYTNYTSDFDFFWRYQMNHMFNRYILFNFAGRLSRTQDADWTFAQLYGIPFFIGLFGLYWHFRRDWRMASSFLILFIIMGYLITFYQNQQEPQPRERDYFYAGAYFVFSLWIALGMRGLLDLLAQRIFKPRVAAAGFAGILSLGMIFIPGRMAQTNYHTHDRSRNWVPWDCSYNILQTCDQDAILFTNGDNDTFPLWYLQDVEGVRRDIRVVNLSLVNTDWYIKQLKDEEPYGAKRIPVTIPDQDIAGIQPMAWEPQVVRVPVPKETYASFGITDTAAINSGRIEWRMPNTLQFGRTKAIRVQDIIVLNIVQANQWERPVYFAVTCSPDSRIGLDEYTRFCGLAWRLMPTKASAADMGIDARVLEANLFNEPSEFSHTRRYGYKFRCTADSGVYYDETEIRMLSTLRSSFRAIAVYESDHTRDTRKSAAVLERMETVLPWSRVPAPLEEKIDFAFLYHRAGQLERFNGLAAGIDSEFRADMEGGRVTNPYLYGAMLRLYELREDYPKALDLLYTLARLYPNDPGIKNQIDTLQVRMRRSHAGAGLR